MRNTKTLVIAEVAITVALCALVNFAAITLPINFAGGSISITMLPIAILALRRGPSIGALGGFIFGMIDLMMEPYIVHWIQVIFDYPLPYILFGLITGFFSRLVLSLLDKRSYAKAITLSLGAIVLGGIGRYIVHVISGVVFFASNAPEGQNVLIYSLVYNISYIAPSLVLVMILTAIILPPLYKAVPPKREVKEASTE